MQLPPKKIAFTVTDNKCQINRIICEELVQDQEFQQRHTSDHKLLLTSKKNIKKFKHYLFKFDYTKSSKNLYTRSRRHGCWRSVVIRGGGNWRTRGKPSTLDGRPQPCHMPTLVHVELKDTFEIA